MPRRSDIRKVLVIGSGPIVIGQAAEFDYSGTQACKALREEGCQVVLVNNNPATIMTDREMADSIYLEPLTVESLEKIIRLDRPQGLLATLGGQTGLNLTVQLEEAGILKKYDVQPLGTALSSIRYAEDREQFKSLMMRIQEPVPESKTVQSVEEAEAFASEIGFPLVIRPAYTLGGTGGGVANTLEELHTTVVRGLAWSMIHQVLVEKYLQGWGEIEYEVMRDGADTCITVCNMENFDPMGVHTGDSIVVSPSQTLTDKTYQRLRSAAQKIIRALSIEGGCNIQFALSPDQKQYYVIEVNPRVSRSSALASKATGYPIARVASKIALGLRLDEIRNRVTGKTYASFEPALDYVVVKIPRWPFDKFTRADRTLGTQMKATGEVMAIGRSFEEALLKAVRSLEIDACGLLYDPLSTISDEALLEKIRIPTDERLFAIAEAFRRNFTVEQIFSACYIQPFFLRSIARIVEMEQEVQQNSASPEHCRRAKKIGFSDACIARLTGKREEEIRELRKTWSIRPVYKMVDTCAGEFEAATPYFYSAYRSENESVSSQRKKIIVIGSGPIRIGQGIEFDYCSIHAVQALQEEGYEAIIINNNPETVSTDFDTSDKLYFEPLTLEDVLHVVDLEKAEGVIVQFGGQTAINLAGPLHAAGAPILGTRVENIDIAEDRKKTDALLQSLGIPRPPGRAVFASSEAFRAAEELGYPVLVRPSYVLGGRAMEIVYDENELKEFVHEAVRATRDKPLLVDKYIRGKELEVDLVSDGNQVLIPGIMEHIERAGIHSGDSVAVYPSVRLSRLVKEKIEDYSTRIARALQVQGLLNIQFVARGEEVFVLEINPRASRTVPFIGKATGIPLVKLAVQVITGKPLKDLGYPLGLLPDGPYYAVKAPVFSFSKLTAVDVQLGPEMKSTGEIMGIGTTYAEALFKAFEGLGMASLAPEKGACLLTVADRDKEESVDIARRLLDLGFKIYSTKGTADFLRARDIPAIPVKKIHEGEPNLLSLIREGKVALLINTVSPNREAEKDGLKIRRASVEMSIPCITSLDTARTLLNAYEFLGWERTEVKPIRANDISVLNSREEGKHARLSEMPGR